MRHAKTARSGGGCVDADELKRQAAGRVSDVISALCGVSRDTLDGRHGPCPKCGGNDRFRFDTEKEYCICNQCFSKANGDVIAAVQWLTGCSFVDAVAQIANHLGIKPARGLGGHKAEGTNRNGDAIDLLESVELLSYADASVDAVFRFWAKHKPPIGIESVKNYGGTPCNFPKTGGKLCLSFCGRSDVDSEHTAALLLYRSDCQEFPARGGLSARKTHLVRGSRESWFFPKAAAKIRNSQVIVKTEGLPDALALDSMGLPDGWVAITNACGAKSASNKRLDFSFAKGKTVIVVVDADKPGVEGGSRFAMAFLNAGAESVKLVKLPYPITEDHGKDLRDWFNDGNTIDDFMELVASALPITHEDTAKCESPKHGFASDNASGGPTVEIGFDESRVIDEAVAALALHSNVYQRGGVLVQIVEDAETPKGIDRPRNAPRVAQIKFPRLREALAASATWLRIDGEKSQQCHPPEWAIRAVDARGQWPGVPRLEGVVESPIIRSDGTILQTPGFDKATGLFYKPSEQFPAISECLTIDDARSAVGDLLEAVDDFPFANHSYASAWLASVLTPVARYAISGPAPLFLTDANVRGCGKSLMTDLTAIVVSGRGMARMVLPAEDDELRKRITAIAIAGEPLVLLDNVGGTLGGPSLDAALTATTWSDRLLGRSEVTTIPLTATWYASGNNVILAADTARRCLHIRLESPEECPEKRTGFRHPNLLAWVKSERTRLATASVVVLAAYHQAGRPSMGIPPWGSFEAWSDLVRQSLVWAGLPDPGETRTRLAEESDSEAQTLRKLLVGWQEIDPAGYGKTAAEAIAIVSSRPDEHQCLREALCELAPPRDGRTLDARRVGVKMKHLLRRVVGGVMLDSKTDRSNMKRWYVRGVSAGSAGIEGSCTIPSWAHTHTHAHAHTSNTRSVATTPFTPGTPCNAMV